MAPNGDDKRHLNTRTPSDSVAHDPSDSSTGYDDREEGQVEKQGGAGPRKFYGVKDPAIRRDVKGAFKVMLNSMETLMLNVDIIMYECMRRFS